MRPTVIDRLQWSVGLLVTVMTHAKVAQPIEMPFGLTIRVDPRKHVLHVGSASPIGGDNFEGEWRPIEDTLR